MPHKVTTLQERKKRAARQRGSRFEFRFADKEGGDIWPQWDGDVEDTDGRRWECKYRTNLFEVKIKDWLEQIYRYAEKWPKNKKWGIVFTGGRPYRNDQWFVVLPYEQYVDLRDRANNTNTNAASG